MKVKSPSCANVGRAVAGTFAGDSDIGPRVVKMELYEMSAPPGNNGGAVSGEAPCPLALETQSNTTSDSDVHFPQPSRNRFPNLTNFPPVKMVIPKHTGACSREPTGGQIRYEEVGRLAGKTLVERANALQSCGQKTLCYEIRKMLAPCRVRRVRK